MRAKNKIPRKLMLHFLLYAFLTILASSPALSYAGLEAERISPDLHEYSYNIEFTDTAESDQEEPVERDMFDLHEYPYSEELFPDAAFRMSAAANPPSVTTNKATGGSDKTATFNGEITFRLQARPRQWGLRSGRSRHRRGPATRLADGGRALAARALR